MQWTYLGHAMWLAKVGELRLLFDPLLEDRHFGDVFDVRPRRRIDVEALRADFIFVSHRHPDHFDVPSLARLARLDPQSVVVTSDELVARTARRLGFTTVARVEPLHRIELEGVQLVTTPSAGEVMEWGVLAASDDGVVWNQVDSVHRGPQDIARILAQAAAALGRPRLESRLELGLVRWQPLLEIQAVTSQNIGFPWRAYATLLDEIAALGAHCVVPASAGQRHAAPYGFMNDLVYPLPMQRFLSDVERRCPATRALPSVVGSAYRVERGEVHDGPADEPLVEKLEGAVPELYRPFALPDLIDPNLANRDEGELRQAVEGWVHDALLPALAGLPPSLSAAAPLKLALEVVFASSRDAYTLVVERREAQLERRMDDDYDVLNAVAGSLLVDVIEGTRHWGELLLAGMLRACHRAYRVDEDRLVRLEVATIFLYYALSYERSHERWVEQQLAGLGF